MMNQLILVTGASGYIAGRLIPHLLEKGWRVRCLARDPGRLRGRAWAGRVEIAAGDVTAPETLAPALEGVWTAYYLVHSMASGRDYIARDFAGAQHFAAAAGRAGLEHIIYVGGLADPRQPIAAHMRSRIETGDALRQGRVPVTEFRAGVIVGPGSISFEMIRFLAEHFPVLAGPRWLLNRAQPVAIGDVLAYLLAALEWRGCRGRIYQIGGPDRMTYAETILRYARARGLHRRWLFAVPFAPVGPMARVVDRLTPVPYPIAHPLIEGLMADSVVDDESALRDFPSICPLGYEAALAVALEQLAPASVERVWEADLRPAVRLRHAGFFVDRRRVWRKTSPEAVFRAVAGLGGGRGWLSADGLWQARGWFDRLLGGPGLRGRRDPHDLRPGDAVDFFRVEAVETGRLIRMRSELKAPGDGWMEWTVTPQDGGTLLTQTVFFAPRGLVGCLYWYVLAMPHQIVFHGLINRLIRSW